MRLSVATTESGVMPLVGSCETCHTAFKIFSLQRRVRLNIQLEFVLDGKKKGQHPLVFRRCAAQIVMGTSVKIAVFVPLLGSLTTVVQSVAFIGQDRRLVTDLCLVA